ncbi:uncharacterized protein TRIADDRAFT_8412, partial [Trichoplax adhaerens]
MKIYLVLLLFFSVVNCYQRYQAQIPNGANVPDPCNTAQFWGGVGHQKRAGGGTRNTFGILMGEVGVQWGRSACLADSDGDGLSNGEELGDPNCVWSVGGNPPIRTTNITHPGICE